MLSPEEISQELILACGGGVVDHVTFLLEQYHGIIDLEYQEPEVHCLICIFSAVQITNIGFLSISME